MSKAVALMDEGDAFAGGGYDEMDFEDSTFADINPTTADLGSIPDPNTTIDPGGGVVLSDPAAFGNDPFPGSYEPPADTTIAPGYNNPPEPLDGITGLEPPSGTEGTPADVPGGTIGAGQLPGTGTSENNAIDQIGQAASNIIGGIFGAVSSVLNGGSANRGVGGTGTTATGNPQQPGSPSSGVNSKTPTPANVGLIDVTSNDSIGLYIVAGILLFVLWKK